MRAHAKRCECVACFDVKVQRASRILARVATVIWAAVAALVIYVAMAVATLPPTPLSAIQPSGLGQSE